VGETAEEDVRIFPFRRAVTFPHGDQQEKIRRGRMSPEKFPQCMVPGMDSIAGERATCF